jgi:hypothetical protein
MKLKNHDITCYKGETFDLGFSIVNADDSPFMISSVVENPYLLFTISSATYKQESRYLRRFWLPLLHIPRLDQLVDYDDLNPEVIGEELLTEYGMTTLFRKTLSDGRREYWYIHENSDGTLSWERYESLMNIVIHFPSAVSIDSDMDFCTSEWIEQRYKYSIKYVTGEDDLRDTLEFITSTMIVEPANIYVLPDVS